MSKYTEMECGNCDGTGRVPGLGGYIVGKWGTVMADCGECDGTGRKTVVTEEEEDA